MKKLSQFISVKSQFIIFLSCVLLYLTYSNHNLKLVTSAAIAVFTALILDSIILSCKNKKLMVSESAIISGLIIAFVLYSDNPKWIFIVAPVIAVLVKQLLRFQHKHLFNPAASGILAVMLLFHASTQWLGTSMWYVFIPFGLYFIAIFRKFEVLVGYLVATLILFGIFIVVSQKGSLLTVFSYLSYFFIFVMLIEPKTTPIKTYGKYLFGIGVAVLIFVFNLIGFPYDTDICALLILNLFVPLLNLIPNPNPRRLQNEQLK